MQPVEGGGSADDRRSDRAASLQAGEAAHRGAWAHSSYYLHLAEDLPEDVLSGLFGELRRLQPERDGAVLIAAAHDQEELTGILARLSMLGFTVLEVRRVVGPDDRSVPGRSSHTEDGQPE